MQAISTASAQGHEHVFLDSDELEDVAPSSIDDELIQATPESRLELRIFNGAYASVLRKGPRDRATDYWLNLAFLDPEPVRVYERRWLVMAGAAALGALAAGFTGASGLSGQLAPQSLVPIALGLLTAGASLGIGLYRSWNRLYFLTRHGRVPVLRLAADKPDRKRLGQFVRRIAAVACSAHARRAVVRSHYLRDEMKEHRRLHEAGVLEEKDYEIARARVLAAHG